MSKKQLVGLVVAGLVFVFVCSAGIYMNSWSRSQEKANTIIGELAPDVNSLPITPYIGVVSVEGTIIDSGTTDIFGNTVGYNHQATLNLIDDMKSSGSNRGILLYVNSPGGSVYDSDELYLKLKEYSDETGRPIWTYMADEACSGGYYIAMASDKIYANRNTVTGSIGVLLSFTNYKDLFDKIGVEEIYITSGKNKTMGAGDLNITDEQLAIFQSQVDESYEQFVGIVSEGRHLDISEVKRLADGRIYTAKQALNNRLIDAVAAFDEMQDAFSEDVGGADIYFPSAEPAFSFNSLFGLAGKLFGKSDSGSVADFLDTNGSGVPMYYAIPGKF